MSRELIKPTSEEAEKWERIYLAYGAHCFSIVFVNDEFIIAVFHLAKILDIVASVNNEIYLRPFPMAAVSIGIRFHAPGISLTQHAGYSKFLFYLSKVMQAYLLKGVPCPCVLLASFTVFCPVMLIRLSP